MTSLIAKAKVTPRFVPGQSCTLTTASNEAMTADVLGDGEVTVVETPAYAVGPLDAPESAFYLSEDAYLQLADQTQHLDIGTGLLVFYAFCLIERVGGCVRRAR